MSAANTTRIFGVKLAIDPKILVGALIALAALLFWYNSRADDSRGSSSSIRPNPAVDPGGGTAPGRKTSPPRRGTPSMNDRGVLRMRPVDPTRGDVDPTLHLALLKRLRAVEEGKVGRSVFEIGAAATPETAAVKITGPKIPVGPVIAAPPVAPAPPPVNIPFKYYGYAKPGENGEVNRGLFLDDGDNVIVAAEGQTVKGHFLVVELTPRQARIEDTQLRRSKDLPVTPMATP